jgi:alpha-1,3-glucosyltransferase
MKGWCICREFLLVSTAATYSLLPLLYRKEEYAIKILLLVLHVCCVWLTLRSSVEDSATMHHSNTSGAASGGKSQQCNHGIDAWNCIPWLFTGGLLLLEAYCSGIHGLLFGEKLSFLPLMLSSVYCGVGMLVVWVGMAVEYVADAH